MNQKTITAAGVILAIVLSTVALVGSNDGSDGRNGRDGLAAQVGPEHTERQYFLAGSQGGGPGSSSTLDKTASATFTVGELRNTDYIELNPTVGAITMTIPATTTAGFSSVVGNGIGATHVIEFYNATTTTGAASVITFAAGTGIDLQEDEGGTVLLNGLETARLTLKRKNDTDVTAWLEIGQVAD